VRAATAVYVDLVRDYAPDIVVDSFGLFPAWRKNSRHSARQRAARQFSSRERRFLWWKGERPADCPAGAGVNKVLAEYGVEPVERSVDLLRATCR